MKTLTEHINESLKIGNKNLSGWSTYTCQPKTKDELRDIIRKRIREQGYECDLNDIDVSLIEDMSWLFDYSWFEGNISNWDVSNVKNMNGMFSGSQFNGDISCWNVSKVENMESMFASSQFNKPIGDWNVSKVKDMGSLFKQSKFNQDISNWEIRKDCMTDRMFISCPIKEEYKPKLPK